MNVQRLQCRPVITSSRACFRLGKSPSNFQRLMDTVLKILVQTECNIYLDNCVIFFSTAEEYARRLEHVLQRFVKANLRLHPGKCVIAQTKVKYLGLELSDKGVSATADKVEAIKGYPKPDNAKEVRAFIGLASFYRRLVPNFAETTKSLTALTRKNQEFTWGPSQQEAFDNLKLKLSTTPVLAFPNFSLPFILTADASKVAVAAILSQVNAAHRICKQAKEQGRTIVHGFRVRDANVGLGDQIFSLLLIWPEDPDPNRSFCPHLSA